MNNVSNKNKINDSEISRYSRQLVLPEIGRDGQEKLKSSSVLCIGSGGLGSPLLLYLSAAGVGKIGIVDYDLVDESNLHRQVIHSMKWLGKPKIESACSRIKEINPNCIVETYKVALTTENALDIISDYDIVCDGTDNFPTRYLVNDACVILGKPNVYGSVLRFEGQASVFNLEKGSPNYRDLVPKPPPPGLVPSCAESGVLGVIPGVIGLIQATEAIKIITQIGNTLNGRLLVFDALDMSFRELNIKVSEDSQSITKLIEYQEFCGYLEEKVVKDQNEIITAKELKLILSTDRNETILVDVRSPNERNFGHLEGSISIPLDTIEEPENIYKLEQISKEKSLIIYCKSGKRSMTALKILKRNNIHCKNLRGGLLSWKEEIDSNINVL
tara:strand:+ start:1099 stop:2259 length:1161 start_codon:yes stop_codon:yes gene_type:complete